VLKVIVWAILAAGVLNAVALLPQAPGVALVLEWVQPGAYTIIASTIAAAAHDRKEMVMLILLGTLLAAYPFDVQDVARLLIPMGIGILLGSLLRTTIQQEQQPERHHELPAR
jgi:hypothetical protein